MPTDSRQIQDLHPRPGDILLMMGNHALSRLIAWASDSDYSHAAIVGMDGQLIEASLDSVRSQSIAARLTDTRLNLHVDLFRHQTPLSDETRQALVENAVRMIGKGYPKDQLLELGVVIAIRGKIPPTALARRVVRIAFDKLVHADPDRLICSELVWRVYEQTDAQLDAGRSLRLRIDPKPHPLRPFPKNLDWSELSSLFNEKLPPLPDPPSRSSFAKWLKQMGLPAFPRLSRLLQRAGHRGAVLTRTELTDEEALSDAAMEQARQQALAYLQCHQPLATGTSNHGATAIGLSLPVNPRTLSPQDLADSPDLAFCRRLMQAEVADMAITS